MNLKQRQSIDFITHRIQFLALETVSVLNRFELTSFTVMAPKTTCSENVKVILFTFKYLFEYFNKMIYVK